MTNEELCLAFQAGDRQAAEQLYLANYSFIRSIALAYSRRYPELWMDVDDFTQEGAIALLRAAETYSPGTNATFLTYARRIIHNAIRDVLRKALAFFGTFKRESPMCGYYQKVFEGLMWRLYKHPDLVHYLGGCELQQVNFRPFA